jgi:hypothetical protein
MNIGFVSFTGTSNVVTVLAPAVTGTKPLWIPAAAGSDAWIGWHGSANVDCVTVWFICENWNCRMSPGFAFTSAGTKTRDLLTVGEPTVTAIIFLTLWSQGRIPWLWVLCLWRLWLWIWLGMVSVPSCTG